MQAVLALSYVLLKVVRSSAVISAIQLTLGLIYNTS